MAVLNMKDIKNRIKSVNSTMQITKAMELVASSKLRRAKEKAIKSQPYFHTIYQTLTDISSSNKDFSSVYTVKREIKNSLFIVIAGDRGLAGGYNSNVLKETLAKTENKNAKVLTIGKKAREFFQKTDLEIIAKYDNISEHISLTQVNSIVKFVTDLYKNEEIDEIFISFTVFVSPLTQTPNIMRVLPFEEPKNNTLMVTEYDPSPETVFNLIVPKYISGILYGAIVESFASEQAARRIAMESASDNASDMIDNLSLLYNRARQGAITQEISEIVSGASSSSSD